MWILFKKITSKNCALLINWRKRGLDSKEKLRKSLISNELEKIIFQEEIS
jgi:hypothetical protein